MKILHIPKQQGAAMLEALVSVLILSLGVLSLVGLQASMLKASSNAGYRAQASNLANQLVGQIWADATNIGNYAVSSGTCTNAVDACTSWVSNVQAQLPSGSANVTVDGGNNVTVTVSWTLPGQDQNNYTMTTTVNVNS